MIYVNGVCNINMDVWMSVVSVCVCVICVYGISMRTCSWGVWYEYVCGVSLYDHVI